MLGSREVTNFQRDGKQYKVLVQAPVDQRVTPNDLNNIYVRGANTGGKLVPLASLVTIQEGANARELIRTDRLRSVMIEASMAPGYTLGQALDYLDGVAAEVLPPEVRISYSGQSREYKDSSAAIFITFGLALIVVFLVLAGQFESWIHPVIIILSVPLAVTGALAGLLLAGQTLNVYSQIGIIMLVGLIAKNGILIVEFANQLRDEGQNIYDAVGERLDRPPAADSDDHHRHGLRRRPSGLRQRRRRRVACRTGLGDRRRHDLCHAAQPVRGAGAVPVAGPIHQAGRVHRPQAQRA